ncbi:MAG: tRNA (N(6)-L-threonylcarbamoyladenosine(37)-C(2))-methylthiotransferase MtaB [Lachnospiraceae bacterium]|nr:tRNA (N(6)-L-threonylcarbamoyladenosine(37)-C(2))-methylthiotransferase MtaB [Lachnospiraceae bacterium]
MTNHLQNKTFSVHTLGCKVNACESEAIKEMLRGCGCKELPFGETVDIVIINTCTVTNIADRKSRQMLHRARTQSPDAVILATGCYVQERSEEHRDDVSVDVLVGNRRKGEIPSILNEVFTNVAQGENGPFLYVGEDAGLKAYEDLPVTHQQERTRAFVKVQDGCNQFCSYCIIPFARGRIASRKLDEVAEEVVALAASGVREVVLNGIHLSSYGLERYSVSEQAALCVNQGELPLLELVRRVAATDGITRVRLGSLEPRIMTENVVAELAKIPKLCPQFHLSLQSGCDETLKAMNRHYTTEEYREVVERLRKHFPDPAITTDIIAGFPGETEEQFETTVAYVREIGFAQVHVFPYSRRKGTVADRMSGQHTEAVKKHRASIIAEAARETMLVYRKKRLGSPLEVLLEEPAVIDGIDCFTGYSREYVPVAIRKDTFSEELVSGSELTVHGTRLLDDGTILVG